MSKSQGWMLLTGIIVGNLSGYFIAANQSIDKEQLTSIIRTELQVISSRQSTSQLSSITPSHNNQQTSLSFDDRQYFINELKQNFREIAEEIINKAPSTPPTTALNNIESQPDQEQIQSALIESQDVLTGAMARGRWSYEDNHNYTTALQNLSGDELTDAYRKLSIAINNGDITPDPESVVQ